jgi:hypothetical protein
MRPAQALLVFAVVLAAGSLGLAIMALYGAELDGAVYAVQGLALALACLCSVPAASAGGASWGSGGARRWSRGRRLVLVVAAAWLLGLAALALALERDAPGPRSQAILGVGIGGYTGPGGIAYLSGRRLACGPADRAPYTARCTVAVAGRELALYARRNPPEDLNQLGGACEAVYAGRTWPCRIGSRHVHVPWFAYLDHGLGLTPAELDAVRRAHPLPNLPEDVFFVGIVVVAGLTALGTGGAVTFWWGAADAAAGRATAGWSAVRGALTAPVVFVLAFFLAAVATGGYWD